MQKDFDILQLRSVTQEEARDKAYREYEKYKDFIIKNLGVTIDEAVEAKEYLEKKRKRLSSPYGGIGGFGGFFRKRK